VLIACCLFNFSLFIVFVFLANYPLPGLLGTAYPLYLNISDNFSYVNANILGYESPAVRHRCVLSPKGRGFCHCDLVLSGAEGAWEAISTQIARLPAAPRGAAGARQAENADLTDFHRFCLFHFPL